MNKNFEQLLEEKLGKVAGGNSNSDIPQAFYDCLSEIEKGEKIVAWQIYHERCNDLDEFYKYLIQEEFRNAFNRNIEDDFPPID